MATKKSNSAMDFLVAELKKNRKAAYADIKAAADKKGLQLYPIMFGRAQAMLGIVKSAKRGTGKFARASATARRTKAGGSPAATRGRKADPSSKSGRIRALLGSGMSATEIAKKVGATTALVYNVRATTGKTGGAPRREPGRPRKANPKLNGVESILAVVQNAERERTQLRAALERIQSVIAGVLE